MTSPRNIAPAHPQPISTENTQPPAQRDLPTQAVGANDVIFVNGQPFNGRGYPVCGVANQRGRLCGRIGTCPFHARQKSATPKRPRSPNQTSNTQPQPSDSKRARAALNVRQMTMPPQKARFKRSWTTEEHRIFLQSMRRHGKGKWKEIASEVKTRTANQCQSHAQKYFLRQAKSDSERKKKSIHDVTEKDVLDTTWNSLQTAARQALAVQQEQQNQEQQQQQRAQQKQQQQGPPSVQTIAPAPAQSVPPPSSTVPSTTMAQRSSTSAIAVSLPPRHPNSAAAASASAIASSTSSAALTGVTQLPQAKQEPTQTTGIPTVNITVPAGSTPQSAAFAAAHSAIASTSLPLIQNGSGISTVPVVLPVSGVGIQYAPMVSSFVHPGIGNPSNAAIMTPPPPAKLRVTVHVNGRLKGGMALMLPSALEKFFERAKNKLQFEGNFKRVFTRSGGEITSLDEMCPDDMLWLSTGEDFLTPR